MTKTLADMTPEERAECVGRWCDHKDKRDGETLAVLANVVLVRGDDNRMKQVAMLYWPREKQLSVAGEALETVTPRFDLPRAWSPDGTPLQATRETITGYEGLYLDAGGDSFPTTPGTTYQRWIVDWQEVE